VVRLPERLPRNGRWVLANTVGQRQRRVPGARRGVAKLARPQGLQPSSGRPEGDTWVTGRFMPAGHRATLEETRQQRACRGSWRGPTGIVQMMGRQADGPSGGRGRCYNKCGAEAPGVGPTLVSLAARPAQRSSKRSRRERKRWAHGLARWSHPEGAER